MEVRRCARLLHTVATGPLRTGQCCCKEAVVRESTRRVDRARMGKNKDPTS